ncbi:hypothetical protein C0992_002329 [Termitomyces sp. T32_za158]|nr:hypothetical protein C0992_002329 [Termitomyces sp. T32_za158]
MSRVGFSDRMDPDLPIVQAITPPSLEWLCLEDINQKSINILLNAWIPVPAAGHDRPVFPRLETLSIGPMDEDEIGPLWELAQAGRASMKRFLWEYFGGTRLVEPLNSRPLDLSTLKGLREISYEVTVYPTYEDEDLVQADDRPEYFDGLLSLLHTVEQGNDIRQVFIRVNFLTLDDVVESLKEYNGWDRLNIVLESERYAHLHGLTLHIDVETETCCERHEMDVDLDLFEKRMQLETLIKERVPVLHRHMESDPEAFMLVVEDEFVV